MKHFLIILLMPILAFSQSQIDKTTKAIYLKEVYQIEGSASDLKSKAAQWVAKSYNNSNYVTRLNESDNIIVKGGFDVGANFTNYGVTVFAKRDVDYTLDLAFKDGRYKIEINNVQLDHQEAGGSISMYLADKEEYRQRMIDFYSTYDGPGKKAAIKRVNNDAKLTKDFQALNNYGLEILPQITSQLNAINQNLLAYMKSTPEDDW